MKYKKIAPSILSADFGCLQQEVFKVEKAGAHLLHLDVMDGHFVPNLTFGPGIVKRLHSLTSLPLDVHLMIENPGQHIEAYVSAGASYISVHMEAAVHLQRILRQIKDSGVKAGVALNPHTPVHTLINVLNDLDFILIMSVNPGFGGQDFIPSTYDKLKRLNTLLEQHNATHIEVEIDGGVKQDNISTLAAAGVDIFVAGSAIFQTPDPGESLKLMYKRLH